MSNVKIEHVTFYKVGYRSFETIQDAEAYLQFEQFRSEIDELKSLIAGSNLLRVDQRPSSDDLQSGSLENALNVAQAIVEFVKQVQEIQNEQT